MRYIVDPVRFRIAEAARMAGVSASTLRLWETQGLVVPEHTAAGQRLYSAEQLRRLKEIAWLRRERGLNPTAIADKLKLNDSLAATEGIQNASSSSERAVPIGLRIRRLRQAGQMTLEAVAKEVAIASSVLSTFERTSVGLSIKSLHELARYFGTTLSALSGQEDDGGRESLVRSEEWETWPSTSPGVAVQVLARGQTAMECHRFELSPGASSEGTYEHEGEEFLHILSGSLEIVLDGDRFFILSSGDSFYFESRRPHAWRNAANLPCVLIWINTPPTF